MSPNDLVIGTGDLTSYVAEAKPKKIRPSKEQPLWHTLAANAALYFVVAVVAFLARSHRSWIVGNRSPTEWIGWLTNLYIAGTMVGLIAFAAWYQTFLSVVRRLAPTWTEGSVLPPLRGWFWRLSHRRLALAFFGCALIGVLALPRATMLVSGLLAAMFGGALLQVVYLEDRRGVQFILRGPFASVFSPKRWVLTAFKARGIPYTDEQLRAVARTKDGLFYLARYKRVDDAERCLIILTTMFQAKPDDKVARQLVCVHVKLGRRAEAVEWLRRADAILPLTEAAMKDRHVKQLRRAGLLKEFGR